MPEVTADRTNWPVGQRVSRKDSEDHGTVTEQNGQIRVRWDDGRTSYFRHGRMANVQLEKIDD